MRCFKRAVETVPQNHQSVALLGIGCAISTMLERVECPPADEVLFEYYFHRTGTFDDVEQSTRKDPGSQFSDSLRSSRRKPVLMLFHPSKPDGALCLHHLRSGPYGRRLETHAVWSAKRPGSRNQFVAVLMRLSYILRLQGMSLKLVGKSFVC